MYRVTWQFPNGRLSKHRLYIQGVAVIAVDHVQRKTPCVVKPDVPPDKQVIFRGAAVDAIFRTKVSSMDAKQELPIGVPAGHTQVPAIAAISFVIDE